MVGAFVLPNYAIILSEMSNLWGNFTMWILVPIITIALLIIAVSSMQYILVMIAFLLIIYSFIEKKIVMGFVSVLFFTYSIYLCATWKDKSLIADNKVETVKAQRETVEREKEMERRRIQEEVDKERYIEKHGMEISENDLKVKLEALVPQEYKGKKYELKVEKFKRYSMYFDLTVQNEKFSNSEECKKFVKEIANDLKKIKISKAYFKFHSKDDGGIYNSVYIDYFRNIQNNLDNVENLEFNEFELKTEEEEKREQEKIEQEKNSYNNYIQNRVVDPLDRIKKLKELLDSGAITQEEYNKKKKELLE